MPAGASIGKGGKLNLTPRKSKRAGPHRMSRKTKRSR